MPAFVQGTGGYAGGGGNLAYASNVTKGHLLVAAVEVKSSSGSASTSVITASDSLGTAYSSVFGIIQNGAGDAFALVWGLAPSTGANTVHFSSNCTALSGYGLNITEFSGVNALDQKSSFNGPTSGASPKTMATPTITPGAASGIAIAFSLGSAVNPTNPISGTNSFTDNYGYWANNAFVDQNWLVFLSAASINTTVTLNFTGTLSGGYIALATFIQSTGGRSRTLMGVGQ